MSMRIDEAGHQDVVLEAVIDLVGVSIHVGLEALQRANGDNLVTVDGNRRGERPAWVHRQDAFGGVDLQLLFVLAHCLVPSAWIVVSSSSVFCFGALSSYTSMTIRPR